MQNGSAYESPLWRRVAAVDFDDPDASLTFTTRLARENRWTRLYAARVVEEYRRFAYLAATAGHEVTPSDEVDQAWHLHLTYTRHYWGVFCEALGAPLHHGPTAGGAAEDDRYHDNYEATLASYRKAFGAEPPADIWPEASVRFASAPFMARINLAETIVLPRKAIWSAGGLLSAAAGAGVLAGGAAAAAEGGVQSLLDKARALPQAVWIGAAAFVVVAIIALARAAASAKAKSSSSGGCGAGGAGCSSGKGGDGGHGGDGGSGCGGGGCGGGCGG